jgi:membrane protein CcdC involved in cytochrome C biogenesis
MFVIRNHGARMIVSYGLACCAIIALAFAIDSSADPMWTGGILFIYTPVVLGILSCCTPLPMGSVVVHGIPKAKRAKWTNSQQFISKSRAFSYAYMAIVVVMTTLHTCLSATSRQDITPFYAVLATTGHVMMWLAVLTGSAYVIVQEQMDLPEHVLFQDEES